MTRATLASLIREAIAHTGLSVNELARRTTIPQQVLQRFVSGRRHHLRTDTIDKLMAVIDLEIRVRATETRNERQRQLVPLLKLARELEIRLETTVESFEHDAHKPVYREFRNEIDLVLLEFKRYSEATNKVLDGATRLLAEIDEC